VIGSSTQVSSVAEVTCSVLLCSTTNRFFYLNRNNTVCLCEIVVKKKVMLLGSTPTLTFTVLHAR